MVTNYEPDYLPLQERLDFTKEPLNMTEEDKLVWRILCTASPEAHKMTAQDEEDSLDHISVFTFTSNYKQYHNSFKRFKVTAEEFFQVLYEANRQNEKVQESEHLEEAVTVQGVCYVKALPFELKLYIVRLCGVSSFFKLMQLDKLWRKMLNPENDKKAVGSIHKQFCYDLWGKARTQGTYLKQFESWRHMLQYRPLIRFDGVYVLKSKYYRSGISETSQYNPIHEVISYRYIRFLKDGTTMSVYTVQTPKKIFEKVKQLFTGQGSSTLFELALGQWWMSNNMVAMLQGEQGSGYRYDFQCFRMSGLPSYKQDQGDYIEQVWQGFRAQVQTDSQFERSLVMLAAGDTERPGYLKYTVNTVIDPVFRFIRVDQFN